MDNQQELFPIVDLDGRVLGSITRGEAHCGTKVLHPVVHLHLMNSRGELYLQRRPLWKDIQPGKWDTACGGHVAYGEDVAHALVREVMEELGVSHFSPVLRVTYVFEGPRERELVYVYTTVYDGPVTPSGDELDGGRFWTVGEISDAMGQGLFTPNFESEYQQYILPYHQALSRCS